jgi:hypothetical protein
VLPKLLLLLMMLPQYCLQLLLLKKQLAGLPWICETWASLSVKSRANGILNG